MGRVLLGPHAAQHGFLVLIKDGSEPVKRFNGANANQVGAGLALAVPLRKHIPESGVVHIFNEQIAKRMILQIDDVIILWHRANPAMLIGLSPTLPINLIRADSAWQRNRQTTPIDVKDVPVGAKDAVHELFAMRVVGFVVHDLHADLDIKATSAHVINNKIQEHAAILAARERHVNALEVLEYKIKPFNGGIVNICL